MGTCFLPLKMFRGRLGERFGVTIVGTPRSNLRSLRDDFASQRRIFRDPLRVTPILPHFGGRSAPVYRGLRRILKN